MAIGPAVERVEDDEVATRSGMERRVEPEPVPAGGPAEEVDRFGPVRLRDPLDDGVDVAHASTERTSGGFASGGCDICRGRVERP